PALPLSHHSASITYIYLLSLHDALPIFPHPSHHEQALADFIIQWAKQKQLWVEQDAAGNILIRKAATAGMEDHQPVALQAHLDKIGRAHVRTPVTFRSRMPSSA